MKKNNKGFMLVEVVVVTVVVVTIMTSLYIVFNRVYNAYDKKSNYTNVDVIYALKMLEDYLIDEVDSDGNIKLNKMLIDNSYFTKIDCEENSYCQSVFDEYNINTAYLVKNNESSFNELRNTVTNQTFKEYIDYLKNIGINTTNFIGDNKIFSELLIAETHSIDSGANKNILNKYAYLPIRIEVVE